MPRFEPRHGKDACRDDGERCLTCGRPLSEIARLRASIDELASLALDADYENSGVCRLRRAQAAQDH
ncbi:hypothetical protein U5801_24930 [Lamprobacter modestohalophilus]|uniref:hypothetical protein n=1 Tax=Lamprobacter modestohalophilus TaxID=1064514 RepID=UPI002ADEA780|nr:hypothetical protein [Lamprobacter modestohalophilus]MEA1053027.1 hypothetical protein [Lamprobacter modestohalophilus]